MPESLVDAVVPVDQRAVEIEDDGVDRQEGPGKRSASPLRSPHDSRRPGKGPGQRPDIV
jgi:hypothetical protein